VGFAPIDGADATPDDSIDWTETTRPSPSACSISRACRS